MKNVVWKEIRPSWVGLWLATGDTQPKDTNRLESRFEVFTTVTMKNGVFWDITPYGSCKSLLGISSQRASVAS
jgi:hypothetical protein